MALRPSIGPTARQLEILILYSRGMSARQIAAELFIEESTAKRHCADIRARFGTGTMAHCLIICLARGYLAIDGEAECARLPAAAEAVAPRDLVAA